MLFNTNFAGLIYQFSVLILKDNSHMLEMFIKFDYYSIAFKFYTILVTFCHFSNQLDDGF